jgi:hypothetical protein
MGTYFSPYQNTQFPQLKKAMDIVNSSSTLFSIGSASGWLANHKDPSEGIGRQKNLLLSDPKLVDSMISLAPGYKYG